MENKDSSFYANLIHDETFEMDSEEIRKLGYQTVDLIVDYIKNIEKDPILPTKTFNQIKEDIRESVPQNERNHIDVLNECNEKIIKNAVRVGNPLFLGWILTSGTTISAFADGIASAINQNVAVSGSSIATAVELLVIDWIKKIIDFDSNAGGILVSGGTVANLTALNVARDNKLGFLNSPINKYEEKKIILYMSEEAHVCILKSAHILGLSKENIRKISVDNNLCLDTQNLKEKIKEDQDNGNHPFAVVATAGTVNSGAIDPLESIADICKKNKIWFHIDAAYGGFASLSSQYKPLLKGIYQADSIALDPHKWLFIPFEAGCVLIKNPLHLKQTFAVNTDYIHLNKLDIQKNNDIDFSDYGIQLSRQFRALKIWMSLKQYGIKKYERLINQNINLTKYFEALIEESSDFEKIMPSNLSVFCFRYNPIHLNEEKNFNNQPNQEIYLNQINQKIIEEMRMDQRAMLSSTIIKGKFVLRSCIVNFRTKKADILKIIKIIREIGEKVDNNLRNNH